MTVSLNRRWARLLLFVAVVASVVFVFWTIPLERVLKRDREIARIRVKDYRFEACVQYALVATEDGWYPCYECATGMIFLKKGEVWKYGKTCIGEDKRYATGLPFKNLDFVSQFGGTEEECLIVEKQKIYNYPNLPECQNRGIFLLRPPGNKIDR